MKEIKNMAKYEKNSIHDNPELQLNVIRDGVDYASTVTDEKSFSILKPNRYIYVNPWT